MLDSLKHKLPTFLFRSPQWLKYPHVIQLDTQNHCNLKCEYCNVKKGGSFDIPRGVMPTLTIKKILNYFGNRKIPLDCVGPFANGEPMLEERLPEICSMIDFYLGCKAVIDTNGTLYKYRERLIHPNLEEVRFTISAATPKTYKIVHGKPLFKQAMKTFDWFNENKHPNQETVLHFILTKNNKHELAYWIALFAGFRRRIFPVHEGLGQLDSMKAVFKGPKENWFMDKNGRRYYDIPSYDRTLPCQCWGILAFSPFGDILHCIDFPYYYNYGKVGERDILKAWRERNLTRMFHSTCNDCSLRRSCFMEIFDRWMK